MVCDGSATPGGGTGQALQEREGTLVADNIRYIH